MNKDLFIMVLLCGCLTLPGCAVGQVNLSDSELSTVNREILSKDEATNTIMLDNKPGDGLAIIEDLDFQIGTIEIELKGENTPGRSFVGMAFNIQNDSTYEAVYFRPFNFQSEEKNRRDHSVQYISHPSHNWRYLRSNHEGQFEAEYGRRPSPEDWFAIRIVVENEKVSVYDKASNQELLSVRRLENQKSSKIGLWMGHNSKGAFRNLRIKP